MANHQYKGSLFSFLFNKPTEHHLLCEVIAPESCITSEDIRLNTMDDILIDQLKNDISFLIPNRYVILTEHQSTWSPNIPLRCPWYASKFYRHVVSDKESIYCNKFILIHAPQFYVFYIKAFHGHLTPVGCAPCPIGADETLGHRTLRDYSLFIHQIDISQKQMPLDKAICESMRYSQRCSNIRKFLSITSSVPPRSET